MAQASLIAAWVMLLFKVVGGMACAVVLLGLILAFIARRSPPKKG